MVSRRRSQGPCSPEKAAPVTRKKGKKAAKKSKASSSITTTSTSALGKRRRSDEPELEDEEEEEEEEENGGGGDSTPTAATGDSTDKASTVSSSRKGRGGMKKARTNEEDNELLVILGAYSETERAKDHGGVVNGGFRQAKFDAKKMKFQKGAEVWNIAKILGLHVDDDEDDQLSVRYLLDKDDAECSTEEEAAKADALRFAKAKSIEAEDDKEERDVITGATAQAWHRRLEKKYAKACKVRGIGSGDTGSGTPTDNKEALDNGYFFGVLHNHFMGTVHAPPEEGSVLSSSNTGLEASGGGEGAGAGAKAAKKLRKKGGKEAILSWCKGNDGRTRVLSSYLLAVHRGETAPGPVSKGTAAFYVTDMHDDGGLDAPVVDVAGYLSGVSNGTAKGLKVKHLRAFACEQLEALAKAGAGYSEAGNQPIYCELKGITPPPAGVSWTKDMLDNLPATSTSSSSSSSSSGEAGIKGGARAPRGGSEEPSAAKQLLHQGADANKKIGDMAKAITSVSTALVKLVGQPEAQGGGGGDTAGEVAALKVEVDSLKSTTQDMNSKLDLLISKLSS